MERLSEKKDIIKELYYVHTTNISATSLTITSSVIEYITLKNSLFMILYNNEQRDIYCKLLEFRGNLIFARYADTTCSRKYSANSFHKMSLKTISRLFVTFTSHPLEPTKEVHILDFTLAYLMAYLKHFS